jgi:alpha-1,3-rhamnosyl/mannosyltransferase
LPAECPTIVTLHDLSVVLHPEWHPAERVAQFERHFPAVLQRCVHFITVSEFVRQEVIRKLGVASDRVSRVYNGIRPELVPLPADQVAAWLKRLGLPPQYLLFVGTIEPRKNLLMLLQAYCKLPEPMRRQWPLVLVGSWGWNAQPIADYLQSTARARGVQRIGYVADEDLPYVYNGARALIYPSRYEGFGLPPLEMMACGGAVLASTAGALIETIGPRAHLVHPDDADGWHRALVRVVSDDDWWNALRADVESVAHAYTWDRCAAETLRIYRSVCRRTERMPLRAAG